MSDEQREMHGDAQPGQQAESQSGAGPVQLSYSIELRRLMDRFVRALNAGESTSTRQQLVAECADYCFENPTVPEARIALGTCALLDALGRLNDKSDEQQRMRAIADIAGITNIPSDVGKMARAQLTELMTHDYVTREECLRGQDTAFAEINDAIACGTEAAMQLSQGELQPEHEEALHAARAALRFYGLNTIDSVIRAMSTLELLQQLKTDLPSMSADSPDKQNPLHAVASSAEKGNLCAIATCNLVEYYCGGRPATRLAAALSPVFSPKDGVLEELLLLDPEEFESAQRLLTDAMDPMVSRLKAKLPKLVAINDWRDPYFSCELLQPREVMKEAA